MGVETVQEEAMSSMPPLMSLNHVSFMCRSVSQSVKFYQEVLGFVSIKRPSSFSFKGACDHPKDNHISFQCSNMKLLMLKLKKMGVEYVTAKVEEEGIQVDQLFFHDPDGNMIEICNCDNLPVLPLSPCRRRR
ncbi:hypothetical protein C4D60_Mb09t00290 [Musa balbisiana]|uniref:VOC domain-containing protein n=1 Tax=Musa balbisiana TaxID=52838 RepID=A0A4S8ICY2_MUSBA|nr:hypothetical protein C4D60_Mb09t00290 [Musa balbisiana]